MIGLPEYMHIKHVSGGELRIIVCRQKILSQTNGVIWLFRTIEPI